MPPLQAAPGLEPGGMTPTPWALLQLLDHSGPQAFAFSSLLFLHFAHFLSSLLRGLPEEVWKGYLAWPVTPQFLLPSPSPGLTMRSPQRVQPWLTAQWPANPIWSWPLSRTSQKFTAEEELLHSKGHEEHPAGSLWDPRSEVQVHKQSGWRKQTGAVFHQGDARGRFWKATVANSLGTRDTECGPRTSTAWDLVKMKSLQTHPRPAGSESPF